MKFIKRYYLLFTLMTLLAGCAHEVAPSGGPGDTTAPAVVYNLPANLTKNFHEKSITLRFSKYMDKSSINDNLAVSPYIPVEYDWSGKELEITFAKPLDSAVTYALTIGTECRDIYGKMPAESYGLVFSTGDVIDTGKISGRVFDKNPAGNYVFAYRLDGINTDTLDPHHTPPNYKVQLGSTGNFSIVALKDGKYRIMCIKDEFKNSLYDQPDAYGSAVKDVELNGGRADSVLMRLGQVIDNSGPQIVDAEGLNRRTVAIDFTESLDSSFLKPNYFFVSDSLGRKKYDIAGLYVGSKSIDRIYIVTKDDLPLNEKLDAGVQILPEGTVRDSSGNKFTDTVLFTNFFAFDEPDTSKPFLISSPIKDSAANVPFATRFLFAFNKAIKVEGFRKAFSFIKLKDSISMDYSLNFLTENLILIDLKNKFDDDSWYRIKIDGREISTVSGVKSMDTVYRYDFKTEDTRGRTDISGSVVRNGFCSGPIFVEMLAINGDGFYKSNADSSDKWIFKNVEPGEYYFRVFCDANGNGIYDFGTPFPYTYSEKFLVLQKHIIVRAKWNVEDVKLILPEQHD